MTVYSGSVDIELEIKESTDEILLNSLNLEIIECYFTYENNKNHRIIPTDTTLQRKNETLAIKFNEHLSKSKGNLFISFRGQLDDSMK